jgi:hypothetical protein
MRYEAKHGYLKKLKKIIWNYIYVPFTITLTPTMSIPTVFYVGEWMIEF